MKLLCHREQLNKPGGRKKRIEKTVFFFLLFLCNISKAYHSVQPFTMCILEVMCNRNVNTYLWSGWRHINRSNELSCGSLSPSYKTGHSIKWSVWLEKTNLGGSGWSQASKRGSRQLRPGGAGQSVWWMRTKGRTSHNYSPELHGEFEGLRVRTQGKCCSLSALESL